MVTVIHTTSTHFSIPAGELYLGADRDLLSELLGGPVGFAYAEEYLSHSGTLDCTVGVSYEIELDDKCPVVASLSGADVPRRDYTGWSFEDQLDGKPNPYANDWKGRFWIGIAEEMPIAAITGEIAFLAARAKFGRCLDLAREKD